MSQKARRVRPQVEDDFDYQLVARARHKARTVPHIVGTQRSNYGKRRRSWMLFDDRDEQNALACVVLANIRRRHHAPPSSVAASGTWSSVSDPSDAWSSVSGPSDTWTTVSDPTDTWT